LDLLMDEVEDKNAEFLNTGENLDLGDESEDDE
jgi:hypothetical protein